MMTSPELEDIDDANLTQAAKSSPVHIAGARCEYLHKFCVYSLLKIHHVFVLAIDLVNNCLPVSHPTNHPFSMSCRSRILMLLVMWMMGLILQVL